MATGRINQVTCLVLNTASSEPGDSEANRDKQDKFTTSNSTETVKQPTTLPVRQKIYDPEREKQSHGQ